MTIVTSFRRGIWYVTNWQGALTFELHTEDLLFSAGVGFLFGAIAVYAIKKVMKLAAIVIGLFLAGLTYLS
jgi:uncharacterized membrane protein (Fun14 family)